MKRFALVALASVTSLSASTPSESYRYDFGTSPARPGYIQLTSLDTETDDAKHRIVMIGGGTVDADSAAAKSFLIFSSTVAEGNYEVSLKFKKRIHQKGITVKTDCRRLVLNDALPSPENDYTLRFTAAVQTPLLSDGGLVQLKDREQGIWRWDDKLQIEIHAESFALDAVEIVRNESMPTIHLVGDSTVTDQPGEPWIGWGQMLPLFFNSNIVISNHSASGLTYASFKQQGRLEKLLEALKPNDTVLLQFGHNDQKERGEGIGPWESYTNSIHEYTQAIQEKGAQPILMTSMKRRRFDAEGRQFETLGDYTQAARKAAFDLDLPLIDLNMMSGVFYAALGPEGSKSAFVHYPPNTFPNQGKALSDDTHFNAYGGHQLARCVIEGLKLAAPNLVPYLREGQNQFDPSYPDPVDSIAIPSSPMSSFNKPDGS